MALGSIRKRTTNKGKLVGYQITIELDRDPVTGKRNRIYHTVHGSKKEADEVLKEMLKNPQPTPTPNHSPAKASMCLRSWMDLWLNECHKYIAQTTRDSYVEKNKNHISPLLGATPLDQLDPIQIQRFVNDLSDKGLSPKTVRNTYNILKAAINRAIELKVLKCSPCVGIDLPKLKRYKASIYNAAQTQQLLECACNDSTSVFVISVLGALLGLRRGEMAALRWNNVNFEAKTLTVCENRVQSSKGVVEKDPKSEAGKRTITISDKALDILKQVKTLYDEACKGIGFHDLGYVLCKENGEPYRPDCITQLWERFIKRSGLPPIRLHDLRHTNATLLIAGGVPAKLVQHRLGHANIGITLQLYVDVLPEMDQDAASKFDDFVFA